MKKLLKITFTLFFTVIIIFGFALPLNPAGNWYQQIMPNLGSKQITDIIFLDSLNGFAIASRNVNPDSSSILRTTNGGDNWQIVQTLTSRKFSRIKFINSLTGFISGGSGSGTPYLYKTIDGGNSWNVVTGATLGNAFWEDMAVLNEDTIWLVDANSLNGGVFRTTNGGASWEQQLNIGSQNPSHIYFYDNDTGYTADNVLYKTVNSGLNWFPIPGGGFSDMYFINNQTGWKAAGTMKKTTDGGASWIDQTLPQGGNILISQIVKFDNVGNDTIWGVGSTIMTGSGNRGTICRTTNGGSNWQFQIPDSNINIFQYQNIDFIKPLVGWAYTGASGVHTTAGGDPVWITGIQQISSQIPTVYKLYQNYPNPFNPVTNIKYAVKRETSNVKLVIFDINGKEIFKLVDKEQSAGTYEVDWNASTYSSEVYFYSLSIDGKTIDTKKMVLIK